MEFSFYKKIFIVLLLLFSITAVNSQTNKVNKQSKYSISAGMGFIYVNTPIFNDFLRSTIPFTNKDSVRNFTAAFEGFAGIEYNVNRKFSMRLDYSYFVRTLTYYFSYYTFDYFYNIHQPMLMGYYLISGTHYSFKLGAGAGMLFSNLKETNSSSSDKPYKSSGPGARAELIYAADLSKSLEAYFSGMVNWYGLGELKDDNGNILKNIRSGETVKLNGLGLGVRLGISIKL
jgi:hypothetical protein